MTRFLFRRAVMTIMVALTVSIATFFLLHFATDPAEALAGDDAPPELVEQIRHDYGFDQPVSIQYVRWIGHVARGDFGESYYLRKPVADLILEHAPVTLLLALSSISVTILIAIPLGIAAAMYPNSIADQIASSIAVAAQAVPNFWLGLMFIYFFAVMLGLLPVSGDEGWKNFVMPAVVLGASSVPVVMRLTRTGLLEVMASDFVRTARSNGFSGRELLVRHAMRNAILPVVSVLAIQLGHKLGGSVVTESVFAINGLGLLALTSILNSDIPTIQMLVFIFA
ncbi:MAG: ABC transporter permease, partial [Alphaproteobacteria bacterium]|nr:ABC transporter permease [Alphaproteobacteria bacterium]